jgi:hypothetical protein
MGNRLSCRDLYVAWHRERVVKARRARGRAVLWAAKDVVRADAAPDNVCLSRQLAPAKLKGCPPVGPPGHLPDTGMTFHGLYPQAGAKPPLLEVGDKCSHSFFESRSLVLAEASVVLEEPRRLFVSRQTS